MPFAVISLHLDCWPWLAACTLPHLVRRRPIDCTEISIVISQVEGIENLPPSNETVMYVPNHSSFLDIFALSGYLPRRFKCAHLRPSSETAQLPEWIT